MKISTCFYSLLVAPKDTFYLHCFIVLLLLVANCLFFGFYPKRRRIKTPACDTIGDAYKKLNAQIFEAHTFKQAEELRPLIDRFDTKEYYDNPDACMRRALRASLTVSFSRRLKELTSLV